MTNTHITIGGHKVTTNKVGQVHTITSVSSGWTIVGYIKWCVINGFCYVIVWGVNASVEGTNQTVCSGLPEGKLLGGSASAPGANLCWVHTGGVLQADIYNTAYGLYTSIVYPVADNWVES